MSESNLAQILGLSSFAASGAGDNIVRLFDEVRPARMPDGIDTDRLSWSVPPLAVMERLNERAELREATSGLSYESLRLSRFAYLRPIAGALVLESPLSQCRVRLTDTRAGKLLSGSSSRVQSRPSVGLRICRSIWSMRSCGCSGAVDFWPAI